MQKGIVINMKIQRESVGVDIFKLVFSMLVVFIHCHPQNDISFIVANGIGRLAVPFFFAAAGYFLAKRLGEARNQGKREGQVLGGYLGRIFKMYLLWSAIYLPLTLVDLTVKHDFRGFRIVLEYLRCFFFTGTYAQLWYLPALLVGAVMAALLCRKIRPRNAFMLGILLFTVGVFDEAYAGYCPRFLSPFFKWYNTIFERTKSGVFFGFVFVALGFVIAQRAEKGKLRSLFACRAGALASAVLVCTEAFWLYKNGISQVELHGAVSVRYGMYFSLLPATFFILQWALQAYLPISETKAYFLRKLSTLIYLVHLLVDGIVVVFLADYVLKWTLSGTMTGFLLILCGTLVLSFGVIKAGKRTDAIGNAMRSLM